MVLLVAAGLTFFFASRLGQLRFDYDFEAFFPNEDSELELYNKYRSTFEHDNEFVLIAAENNKGIFREDFLLKADSFTRHLQQLPFVVRVMSPTTLKRISYGGLVPVAFSLLHIDEPAKYSADSMQIYSDPSLVGSFFPQDGRSMSFFVKTQPGLSKEKSDSLATLISTLSYRAGFDEVHLAGRIFAQQVYLETLQKEFILFICISFLLIILFLWFSFRNFYGVMIPLLIVVTGMIWTLGLMSLFGKAIDLMTTMLPTMIFIAGTSDVVHFLSKYFDPQTRLLPKNEIFSQIIRKVGVPTFFTLVTTAVAFLSLMFSSVKPVREFGIYTAAGISIAFILTYTLLPAILFFTQTGSAVQIEKQQKLGPALGKLMFYVLRNQKALFAGTLIIVVIAITGLTRIRVNHTLLEDLNDRVQIKKDFMFFDKHYSGARPLEIKVSALKGNLFDHHLMHSIHRVDSAVRKIYGAGFLLSPAVIAAELYKTTSPDTAAGFPEKADYLNVRNQMMENRKNRDLQRYINAEGTEGRISAKIRDMGSSRVNTLNEALLTFIDEEIDKELLRFEITGAAHLIDRNNSYMVKNMVQGFVFSVVLIGLLTFFLHRSWRMLVVFIIPNLLPLVIIGGIMGFAGIELKAATSIVFTIAFGIATDDTIHFISRLKIEKNYGKSLLYAFKRTWLETGKPIVLTTFVLIGGFMSLMASSFQSTFYFGLLICITVLVALLADLFVLPLLLFLLYKKKDDSLK